jgi:hypothetical protein
MRTPLFVLFLLAGLFIWQDNANAQGSSCATAVTAVNGANVTPLFDGNGGASGISCTGQFSDLTTNLDGYWYTYTAVGTGAHQISTCGSTQDTRVNVLTGPCGGPYTCIAGNDDACGLQSDLSVNMVSGNQYWIVWDDRWSSGDDGFNWQFTAVVPAGTCFDGIQNGTETGVDCGGTCPPCPAAPGSECAAAVPAVSGTNTAPLFDGNGGFAGISCTGQLGDAVTNADAFWYSYTALATGTHNITSCGSLKDTRVNVLTGPCGGPYTCVGGNDDAVPSCGSFSSNLDIDLTAGQTYYIVWDDRWAPGDDGFDWTLTAPAPPPAAIPTMGQWGLITLFLIMLSMGTVLVMRRQASVAGTNVSVADNKVPFSKALYPKVLVACLVAVAAIFAVAVAFFGYELTNADIPGSLLATPVLAYLVHLVIGKKNA